MNADIAIANKNLGFTPLAKLPCTGMRVLLRVDFNVPVKMQDGQRQVADDSRLRAHLPCLLDLRERGAKIIILSHFGRPKMAHDAENSLRFLVPALEQLLGQTVKFSEDCIGDAAEKAVAGLQNREILLLENLRFHAGEEANAPEFVSALARLGDVFVNDAFSVSHRAHASISGLAAVLPAAAGLAMEKELHALHAALTQPQRPVLALVGGAKISTKLQLLGNLIGRVDCLVLGGAMANTFLAAQFAEQGLTLGRSLIEPEMLETARAIMQDAALRGCEIILPVDGLAADAFSEAAPRRIVAVEAVPEQAMLLDVGPASMARIVAAIKKARTLLWNGPLGAFEMPAFAVGTKHVAQAAAALTQSGQLCSVAGGGDTLAALGAAGVLDQFTYVSTAGGAFLEWLEGKTLPGVAALEAALVK